jgi:hypothetical protein
MIATTVSTALVFVLAFASVAQAECSWVLWGTTVGAEATATAVSGHTTIADCQREQKKWEARIADQRKVELEAMKRGEIASSSLPTYFRCLPDTVDPRAPKGSGR